MAELEDYPDIESIMSSSDNKHLIDQMLGPDIRTKTSINIRQIQAAASILAETEEDPEHWQPIIRYVSQFLHLMVSHDRKSRGETVKLFAESRAVAKIREQKKDITEEMRK